MKLHDYQQNCLEVLGDFFDKAAAHGADVAFTLATGRQYIPVAGLREGMPYVCVRVPTGGGKTFMSAHALITAAEKFCHTETPLCLWLAPSATIVAQTDAALRNLEHPYRRALENAFPEVNIMSVKDALQGNFDLQGAANIIVCTTQSLRIDEDKIYKRKIYEDNGYLMAYFETLPEEEREGMLNEDGAFHMSLANVLALHRPIVIVDEAHNARTPISFESLGRFNPSCILEFTATPQTNARKKDNTPSNVLHQVSARELRRAEMIKLPIYMESHADWRETMSRAIAQRKELESAAAKDGRGIRPITLYQAARSGGGEAQVDTVKTALMEQFNVPEEQIAVATGKLNEIEGVDILAKDCQIRHIITIQALAEGWDCPYAYILCGLANLSSPKAVEQILGRVLRMPHAKESEHAELNRAYAFVSSSNFRIAAGCLKEALIVGEGFQKLDADDFVYGREGKQGPLFGKDIYDLPNVDNARIPLLAAQDQSGTWRFVEEADFLDAKWDISKSSATLTDFALPQDGGGGEIDVGKSDKVKVDVHAFTEQVRAQLSFAGVDKEATKTGLVSWLDANIPHYDIAQPQFAAFALNVVDTLLKEHGEEYLQSLGRHRFYLQKAVQKRVNEHRCAARRAGVQTALGGMLPDGDTIGESPDILVEMNARNYAPHWVDEDAQLDNHLFSRIGELKATGEEFHCAAFLSDMPEVEFWIRNLANRQNTSFWLPTADGLFYPDFVARLKDGRWLVVEYKGEGFYNDKAKHKEVIGNLWASRDPARRIFVMPVDRDFQKITNACK